MNTKKYTFDTKPSLVANEGKTLLVCFGVEERTEAVKNNNESSSDEEESEEQTRTVYDCYCVRITQPFDKDKVVDAIVSYVYPSDKMQAIINNHLLDSEDDEDYETHEAEYKEMQAFRKEAKQVAKQVIVEYTEKYC